MYCLFVRFPFTVLVCFLLLYFSAMSAIFRSRYERRWERLECTRFVNCCARAGACIAISICVTKGIFCTTLFLVTSLLSTVLFFYCLAIEMIGRLSWERLIRSTEIHIFEISYGFSDEKIILWRRIGEKRLKCVVVPYS